MKFICILLEIVDMKDTKKKIKVYFNRGLYPNYCAFNLDNKFILYGNVYKNRNIEKRNSYVWIYNTEDKLNTNTKEYKTYYINDDDDTIFYTPPKDVNEYIWECEEI